MHNWGDEGIDFAGIEEAAFWIGQQLRRYGRVGVSQTKEKYGTARVYCHFGWYSFNCITHPGYVYSRYPKWLRWWDYSKPVNLLFRILNYVVIPSHKRLYRKVYKASLVKWPHLHLEILAGADWEELLKGLSPQFDQYLKETRSANETV